jgi:uncharacterized cupredoxin-like copper-binding protein
MQQRRRRAAVGSLAAAGLMLGALTGLAAGCGGSGEPAAVTVTQRHSSGASTITIKVTASEWKFRLSRSSVPVGTTVIFKVTNKGKISHDFKINSKKTPLMLPGLMKTIKVKFSKQGRLTFLCTIAGHAILGMTGKFGVGVRA